MGRYEAVCFACVFLHACFACVFCILNHYAARVRGEEGAGGRNRGLGVRAGGYMWLRPLAWRAGRKVQWRSSKERVQDNTRIGCGRGETVQ